MRSSTCTRLTFVYLAAHLLDGRSTEQITDQVLEHLEGTQAALRKAWGTGGLANINNQRWDDFDARMQERLAEQLDPSGLEQIKLNPVSGIDEGYQQIILEEMGRRRLTDSYRQLLVNVISELWVEYLTQMEGLRVSIGLEAYAQRDPLVQYKARASELFAALLANMRQGVVNRMFTFTPRSQATAQAERPVIGRRIEEPGNTLPAGDEAASEEMQNQSADVEVETSESEQEEADGMSRSQKRRRHRR